MKIANSMECIKSLKMLGVWKKGKKGFTEFFPLLNLQKEKLRNKKIPMENMRNYNLLFP
jgi:hypothetical protein